MNHSIRRFGSAVVAATALAIGVAAAPASATPFLSASLAQPVGPDALNDYTISVSGHIEMGNADAQAACAHPGDPVDVELYGQDSGITFGDDLLITKASWAAQAMSCTAVSSGLNYSVSIARDGDVLNEDRPGDDELYAYVTFLDIRTGQTHVAASNVRTGRF